MEPGRIKVRNGRPPGDDKDFKDCLRSVGSSSTRQIERNMTKEVLPNGTWLVQGVVEIWVPVGIVIVVETVARAISKGLAALIARGRLPLLDEGRWKGSREACARILIGLGVNKILLSSFQKFCEAAVAKPTLHDSATEAAKRRRSKCVAVGAVPAIVDAAGVAEEPTLTIGPKPLWEIEREETDNSRRLALAWLRSDPLAEMYILAVLLELFEKLNDLYL